MSDYYDLGSYGKSISTTSTEARLWFNRGLVWCYGYNHEEAVRCFEKSAAYDPGCVMAYWGLAYALGPNYNKGWDDFDEQERATCLKRARSAIDQALSHVKEAGIEHALVNALQHRYPSEAESHDFNECNDRYAAAMREVYADHVDDLDVVTLFAESMMMRTPWALWDLKTGRVAEGADTAEAMTVMEKAFENHAAKTHPGLLHMYIHLMEMSPHPERALRAADWLRELVPDSGHLLHMPTHIDVLCGHYHNVVVGNSKAIQADRKYLEREGAVNFYSLYRSHNYHFKLYGAMFLGQYEAALEAAEELIETLPEQLLELQVPPMADWMEGFYSMKMHVLIRFGKWKEIIQTPLPQNQQLYCVTTAMIHYAKGVAHAASGQLPEAEAQRSLFEKALRQVPETRCVFNNTCLDILAIASEMLQGELAYRKGDFTEAFDHLRKSVALDDSLPYDEPWGWMQPTRHALGALLLEQGHVAEAEAVYRADLGFDATLIRSSQHPENIWSLHGFYECLQRLDRVDEAIIIKQRLDLALARVDTPIKASCYCRTHGDPHCC